MRQAVLHGPKDLRIEDVPDPVPGPGEALVRVESALTCGTDLKIWRRGAHAKFPKTPFPFGHEFSGVIEGLGEGTKNFRDGDRVVAANSAPCGLCGPCQRNRPSLCESLVFLNGAFAEKILVPARIVEKNLLHLGPNLPPLGAGLVEPLACALKGVDDAFVRAGDTVLVLGSGPLGLMIAMLARRCGARVVLLGKGTARLKAAGGLGLVATLDLASGVDVQAEVTRALGGRPDKVIEAVGTEGAWALALDLVAPGGLVLFFGGCSSGTRVSMDAGRVHYEELTLRGSFHHTPAHVREAFHILSEKPEAFKFLLSGEAKLEDLPSVFHRLDRREVPFKLAVRP